MLISSHITSPHEKKRRQRRQVRQVPTSSSTRKHGLADKQHLRRQAGMRRHWVHPRCSSRLSTLDSGLTPVRKEEIRSSVVAKAEAGGQFAVLARTVKRARGQATTLDWRRAVDRHTNHRSTTARERYKRSAFRCSDSSCGDEVKNKLV